MKESSPKRVVVTGMGVVTSLGGLPDFWTHLLAGKSGITRVERFDVAEYPCQVGAEIKDFDPTLYMDAKEAKRNDRYTHFAVAASRMAMADGGLNPAQVAAPERFGVIIGSGIGGMETIERQSRTLFERGPRKVSPFMIPSLISNMAAGVVAITVGAKGINFGVVSACATGSHAIGEAWQHLRHGHADLILAGGSEAAITALGYAGFCAMKAMATAYNATPERASRPFEKNRDGFVMGEGAGVLMLETLEHAQARGAKIYVELVGYGASCDAFHITSPDETGAGLAHAIHSALREAQLTPEAVQYVNAHGTGTAYNDKFETAALKRAFGAHAARLKISSTKSMTGHLLGAAGAIEAVACVKAIEAGWIPPTINYDEPDSDCDLNYIPNHKQQASVKVAISNNSGFGGQNSSLVFRAFDE